MTAHFGSVSFVPDNLIAGNHDELVGEKITLLSGQNLVRGAVIGKVTASGKYKISLAADTIGSETPDLILAEDCDATLSDKQTIAYSRGDFIAQALTIGTGHTATSIKEGLRVKNIILINAQV